MEARMLHLEGFIHRDRLAEVISRWMTNQAQAGDARFIKKAINFNSYMARVWIDDLMRRILPPLVGPVQCNVVKTKGQLKDFVVDHPTYTTPRIDEMRTRYRKFPEDFYRETPIEGCFYTAGASQSPRFVGGTRIKHFRRIAEKGSRRIVDFMLARIRENADALAEERARRLGVPKSRLVTPQEQMIEEFLHAERRVLKSIKRGTIQEGMPLLSIPDVVGAKVIVDVQEYGRLREIIEKTGACEIAEEEAHRGVYNAVNMRVMYKLPKGLLMSLPPSGGYLRVLAFRGFDPTNVAQEYREFIATGEERVMVEIIVSDFQEYLESELGRSMHEDRVLSQRSHPDYNGFLATNIRYLMDYILGGLCVGAGMPEVSDVPIKLWVRYMPDTVEHIMRGLYLPREVFFDSVMEPPASSAAELPALPTAARAAPPP
jgi:hypothetical protein